MKTAPEILFFIDQLGSGGAQRQMTELAKGFRERGVDVSFLVYHDNDFYSEALNIENFHVELIEEKNYLRRFLKLRKYIRAGRFDAVLSFLPSPNVTSCLSGFPYRKWKVVIGERNADPAILGNPRNRHKLKAYRLADYVTSNSHANIDMVCRAVPSVKREKTRVIYNIVDFDRFAHTPGPTCTPDGKFRVIITARHHYQKNLDGLIEAVKLTSPETRHRLVISWYGDIGDEAIWRAGLKKISDYGLGGIFDFHPAVKDVERVMADADAVGLFSFYEGLPNAVCEGMAMGKPVVATAVSDVPRLISDTNLLCDPNNPRSMASSLEYLLAMSPEKLRQTGETNRQRALELFDRQHILDQYLTLLLPCQ